MSRPTIAHPNAFSRLQPVRRLSSLSGALRILLAAVALFALPATSFALEVKAFDRMSFKAAEEAGKRILIHIHAPWCPTCKAQDSAIDMLKSKPALNDLAIFRVDFDTQTKDVRAFKATTQSTLIVYQGSREVARAVGITKPESIEALLTTEAQ